MDNNYPFYYDKCGTIIISSDFNGEIDEIIKLIDDHKYNELIFSNYKECADSYSLNNKYSSRHQELLEKSDNVDDGYCGSYFDRNIDNLPSNLIKINLGDSFNQNINNLSKILRFMSLGVSFSKSINNLPNLLHNLELLCSKINCAYYLTNSIKKFIFGDMTPFNKHFKNIINLVNSLTEIKLGERVNAKIIKIPTNTKKIYCFKYYRHIKKYKYFKHFVKYYD